jgi:hypothetical protein
MFLKIYKPEIFQGNLKKIYYFEGYYFKHVSRDLENVYSFIPGISLSGRDKHAFIQAINGISGETEYITYPQKNSDGTGKDSALRSGILSLQIPISI